MKGIIILKSNFYIVFLGHDLKLDKFQYKKSMLVHW